MGRMETTDKKRTSRSTSLRPSAMTKEETETERDWKKVVLVLFLLLLLLAPSFIATDTADIFIPNSSGGSGDIAIQVVDGDDDTPPAQTSVELKETSSGNTVATGETGGNGELTFTDIEKGTYDVYVDGTREKSGYSFDGNDVTLTVTISGNYGPPKPDE